MPLLADGTRHTVQMVLNGRKVTGSAPPNMLLSDFLRAELGATGTHVGCEHGVCGACTVRVDGRAVRSCLYLAVQAIGRTVQTVESASDVDGTLRSLQAAFHRNFALQCGFCTPGFLMTLWEFLERNSDPTELEVRETLSGNMCRCTGYGEIVTAALETAAELRARRGSPNGEGRRK